MDGVRQIGSNLENPHPYNHPYTIDPIVLGAGLKYTLGYPLLGDSQIDYVSFPLNFQVIFV